MSDLLLCVYTFGRNGSNYFFHLAAIAAFLLPHFLLKEFMQSRQLKLIHLVTILCLVVFAFSTRSIASQKDGLLKVYFFDIGQGDSIFIEAPNGNQVLVDGGPDNSVLQKLGEAMPFYDKDIDLVVLSHPHLDHYNGLIEVLNRYDVANIMEAREEPKEKALSAGFSAWRETVKKENANEIEPIAGKVIDLGNNAELVILHPFESVAGDRPGNVHDDMVVAMLRYGEFEVLLTGDMEEKVERRLILAQEDLDSDILKVGHHGSKTSSSEAFLAAVSPEAVVISVGAKNRYGHPTQEVLKRLDDYGIKYYRTDTDGDIKVVSDGRSYQVLKNR